MDAAPDEEARRRDCNGVSDSLVEMVRCHILPPDDAYAWTRIVCEMIRVRYPELNLTAEIAHDNPFSRWLVAVFLIGCSALVS